MHFTYGAADCNRPTALRFTRNISREAHVPQSLRSSIWFQHDGASPHDINDTSTNDILQHLKVTFGKHRIYRGGPVQWPARSLSCLEFFCWCQMNTLVYEIPFDSVEDIVAHISVASGEMRDMLGIFQNVEACVTASG
ncbi:hypothetical protein AVEN_209856-1 [Araneus ventricosus]|uniref:Uncharacterized protein n=1 Tax=Araneus ventricosus TaxID=182803 RepID=A0A4Y2IS52_ARAVE|nr:hypothetical protein AVEN_209856-1 [Araneus ventricosus]